MSFNVPNYDIIRFKKILIIYLVIIDFSIRIYLAIFVYRLITTKKLSNILLSPSRFKNKSIIKSIIIFDWLIDSCFSPNRLPRVNGMYVSYLSDLTFLFCPSLRGLKNPFLEKGKAGTPSTLRTKESTVWFLSYVSVQWPCPSYLMCESRDTRDSIWPLGASPAPRTPHSALRRLLSSLLRACAPRTPPPF
jgi:hypothetical protein